jgi:hypothetical protein
MATARNACPVCGYASLQAPAWSGDSPSYEICPCCGTEFGYDDFATTEDDRKTRHLELRASWIERGCSWWSAGLDPPEGWDPTAQLRMLEHTKDA